MTPSPGRTAAVILSGSLLTAVTALSQPAMADDIFQPEVTSIVTTAGPTTGGTPVTIFGEDISNLLRVTFDGTPAKIVSAYGDWARVLTPPHAAGPVVVRVTVAGETAPVTSPASLSGRYTYRSTDTVAPPAPTGITARNHFGVLDVGWAPGPAGSDITGYNVYGKFYGQTAWNRVATNTRGHMKIAEDFEYPSYYTNSETVTAYTGDRYQLAVTAVDSFGNESAPSPVVRGASAPTTFAAFNADEGSYFNRDNTYWDPQGGGVVIDRDTTWSPAIAKVFAVQGPIDIRPGATLTVEAGTVIKFGHASYGPEKGSVIVRDGASLVVKGTAAQPVIATKSGDATNGPAYTNYQGGDFDGNWYGVVAAPKATVTYSHVQVRFADRPFTRCTTIGEDAVPCLD